LRTAWIKVEFKITNEDGVRSSHAKFEIDCKKETIRFLTEARFAEPNLKGKLVSEKDFSNSLPTLIAPGCYIPMEVPQLGLSLNTDSRQKQLRRRDRLSVS